MSEGESRDNGKNTVGCVIIGAGAAVILYLAVSIFELCIPPPADATVESIRTGYSQELNPTHNLREEAYRQVNDVGSQTIDGEDLEGIVE